MGKQKKDILFLCQYFYPEYVSSATLPYDTALALSKSGYSVDVLCGYPREYILSNDVPYEEVHKNINIKRLKYAQREKTDFFGRIINYFSFMFAVLLKLAKFRHYKSVIVYSNPPILPFVTFIANKLFKTKVIFVAYDIYPEIAINTNTIGDKSFITKVMNVINKLSFKNMSRVVALSNEMKDYINLNRTGINNDSIKVIPNWYEDQKGRNNRKINGELFKELMSEKRLIVSYFGNMGTAQDMDTILHSIKELKNEKQVHFLIAGHGNKKEKIKNEINIQELNNVHVFDFLHGEDYQEALEISDAFIVSLEKGLDGLAVPSKTYAYMMAGKPVFAIMDKKSDIVKDLVQNDAGFHIEHGDAKQFKRNVINLLENDKIREKMGKNCRLVYLEKYTKEICTSKYISMFDEILGGRNVQR